VCIYARKVTGSKVYKFDSIKEASRHFKVSPSTVKYRLISKSTLKGFELSKQDFV
jgi:transposase